jgi:alpha-galactosidase
MRYLLTLALLLPLTAPAQTPSTKFAQHPYMGWSTWSFLRGKPTEEKVKAQVDALFAAHLPDYGYRYINLDAG